MSLYLKTAYCVRSSVHLAMASTVEARTAEEVKSLSKTESCDLKPVAAILQLINRISTTVSTFDTWPWYSKNATVTH